MEWWHWLLLGLLCAALEVATPGGFFVFFFGLAGVLVGLLSLAGLAGPTWVQWLAFSAFSVGSLLLFRAPLLRALQRSQPPERTIDTLVGETAVPLDAIAPGDVGRAELRGTVWSARNAAASALAPGQRCHVTAVEGLQISIAPTT